MLRQEINLYQPNGKKSEIIYFPDWIHYCYITASFVIIMLLIFIFSFGKLQYLKSKQNKIDAQVFSLKNRFYASKQKYPEFFFTEDVAETIGDLKKQLDAQNKILSTIENKTLFSDYFVTLPKLITSDVWLTEIGIDSVDSIVTLKGKSRSMQNLQAFISRVITDELFINSVLNIKSINKDESDLESNELIFEISLVNR